MRGSHAPRPPVKLAAMHCHSISTSVLSRLLFHHLPSEPRPGAQIPTRWGLATFANSFVMRRCNAPPVNPLECADTKNTRGGPVAQPLLALVTGTHPDRRCPICRRTVPDFRVSNLEFRKF